MACLFCIDCLGTNIKTKNGSSNNKYKNYCGDCGSETIEFDEWDDHHDREENFDEEEDSE